MLRHYVFLKYREGTSDGHVTAFCERMLALRGTIGGIQHLEIGRDELHDARSWDLVLIMEFASVAALRAYQRHPQHLASWPSTTHSWRTWRRWTSHRLLQRREVTSRQREDEQVVARARAQFWSQGAEPALRERHPVDTATYCLPSTA